jgi:hypothetical protein
MIKKPIDHGNNIYGRTGCKRCLQCRKWKQKVRQFLYHLLRQCEYDNVKLPCKLCKDRGFRCGEAEKVSGKMAMHKGKAQTRPAQHIFAIARPPATFPDEVLTRRDFEYLSLLLPSRFQGVANKNCWTTICIGRNTFKIPVPDFPLSSRVFRYALLSFAASRVPPVQTTSDKYEYLAKFYTYAHEALGSSSLLELVMASYIMLMHEFSFCNEPLQEPSHLLTYFAGIWHSVVQLGQKSSTETNPYIVIIKILCRWSLVALRSYAMSTNCMQETPSLLDYSLKPALRGLRSEFPFDSVSEDPTGKLQATQHCTELYWDLYVALKSQRSVGSVDSDMETQQAVAHSLREAVGHSVLLTNTIPAYSEFLIGVMDTQVTPIPWTSVHPAPHGSISVPNSIPSHTSILAPTKLLLRSALKFAMSLFIRDIALTPISGVNIELAKTRATDLCRIIAIVPQIYIPNLYPRILRTLFWTALILTAQINSSGKT